MGGTLVTEQPTELDRGVGVADPSNITGASLHANPPGGAGPTEEELRKAAVKPPPSLGDLPADLAGQGGASSGTAASGGASAQQKPAKPTVEEKAVQRAIQSLNYSVTSKVLEQLQLGLGSVSVHALEVNDQELIQRVAQASTALDQVTDHLYRREGNKKPQLSGEDFAKMNAAMNFLTELDAVPPDMGWALAHGLGETKTQLEMVSAADGLYQSYSGQRDYKFIRAMNDLCNPAFIPTPIYKVEEEYGGEQQNAWFGSAQRAVMSAVAIVAVATGHKISDSY